jgi:hypothetical protein
VISGFIRGISCEYHSMAINPTYLQERFYEAHDLIIKAWTQPQPPRYVSSATMRRILGFYKDLDFASMGFEELNERG